MLAEDTLPKLLLRNAGQWPDDDAMREKEYGIWQTYTWKDAAEATRRFALGLASLGFSEGDKLAVIGDNRPQLYLATVAAQSLGGVSLGLYQDSISKEMSFIIDHSEARFILAEDEEQVDKLFEIREQIPKVEKVIFDDPRGLSVRGDPWLIHYPEVQKLGDEFGAGHPDHFDNGVAQGKGSDIAILSYTSGTTGNPKGVVLTHENLISGFREIARSEGWDHNDEVIAYLPMAWIGDYCYTFTSSLITGFTISCIERAETYRRDFREIGPTLFLGPPRQWETAGTNIQVRMEEADWLKRGLFNRFMSIGLKIEERRQENLPIPFLWKVLWWVGNVVIFLPIRDIMGARRVRQAYSGGAPLSPDLMNFFRSMGINLKQLYGLTESAAAATLQPDGEANSESMGKPVAGVDVKIGDNGEILLRGKNIFTSYYKNEEATRESKNAEGWLFTGDAGFIDAQGHLKVIDRAKDVSKLNNGTLFAPQYLENKLKFSPYISEAVVLGKEKDYTAAMINIDLETLENWAERNNLAYTNYQDLSQKQEVYKLIREEIEKINARLAQDKELEGAQIQRFLILNKELDPDDGEITRTRKIRRGVIGDRYGEFIEALYSGAKNAAIEIQVTYEDGRVGNFSSFAEIWEVSNPAGLGKANP